MDETRALLDALMGPNRNSKADKAGGGIPSCSAARTRKKHMFFFCILYFFSFYIFFDGFLMDL